MLTAAAQDAKPTTTTVAAPKVEGRAVWVTRWDFKKPEDVDKIMKNIAAMNFNTVVFQVRGNGTAYYKSNIEPWAWELTSDGPETTGKDPGWDPLDRAIKSAHANGLELHAWMNVFPGWRTQKYPPASAHQLWTEHPDWFMVDKKGEKMLPPDKEKGSQWGDWYSFINPALPAVKDYTVSVFAEVVTKYPVDAIHYDYIRYPGEIDDFSYDAYSVSQFRKEHGTSPEEQPLQWARWRSDQVTQIQRRIYYEVQRIRPGTKVAGSVIAAYDRAKSRYFARSVDWLEEGILDIAMPMNYTADVADFKTRNVPFLEGAGGRFVFPGLNVSRSGGAEGMIAQIAAAREQGAPGVGVYSYSALTDNGEINDAGKALVAGPFKDKVPAPEAKWIPAKK